MRSSIKSLNKLKSKKGQFGFTLMEIIFALTIIGAATILIISSFNNTDATEAAHSETQNVNSLSASIKHMFKTQGDYEGLTPAVVLTDVSFPEQMRESSGTKIKSVWYSDGYDVEADTDESSNDRYIITMKSVPEGACTSIAAATYRHFEIVEVDGTEITGVANASTSCTDGDVDIKFYDR